MEEVWKDIDDYEGLYQVSNLGRVRSLPRTTTNGKILKTYISKHNGYVYASLSKKNYRTTARVHKLIYNTFNKEKIKKGYNPLKNINHIDGDKTNNRLDNLEAVTQSENQKHAYRLGLQKTINNKKVIRLEDGKIYNSITEAAKDVNGQISKVCFCCKGLRKHHRKYSYRYYEEGDANA